MLICKTCRRPFTKDDATIDYKDRDGVVTRITFNCPCGDYFELWEWEEYTLEELLQEKGLSL